MSDVRDRLQQLLDGELEPSEIADDAALVSLADRLYGIKIAPVKPVKARDFVPSAPGLPVTEVAPPTEMLIEVIYARGAFDDKDVNNVSIALLAYGLGVPAFISIKVLQAPFFAMRDTITPFRISIFSVLVNILLSIILMKYLGFFGIALATSISSYLTSICYFLILLKKVQLEL